MSDEPALRKKHIARDKNKHKNNYYSNKHIRIHESIRGGMVPPSGPPQK